VAGDLTTARRWAEQSAASARVLDAPVLTAWALRLVARLAVSASDDDAAGAVLTATSVERVVGLVGAADVVERLLSRRPVGAGSGSTRLEPEGPARASSMQSLQVRCFGNFRIERGGVPASLPGLRPRSRALLLLLALQHGRDLHREVLMEALWPDAPFGAATHRLQVAASNVRQCLAAAGLGDGTVERHGDAYRLVLPEARFDIDEFEEHGRLAARAEAAGDLETALEHRSRAVDVYSDDLLPEMGPSEWVVLERDRIRIACAATAMAAAQAHRTLGRAEDALRMARRAISLEPLRDSGWTLLAKIQEDMGDRTAAEVTRREFRRVREELDVDLEPVARPG
jgi:DNA-binding SARP family transcriptional activator